LLSINALTLPLGPTTAKAIKYSGRIVVLIAMSAVALTQAPISKKKLPNRIKCASAELACLAIFTSFITFTSFLENIFDDAL
jgi:hypothetical protein